MKTPCVFMTALIALGLGANSNPLMAQSADANAKTGQELAKENAELRRQNAELRERLRRLDAKGFTATANNTSITVQPRNSAASVMAADLPVKARPYVAPTVYSWTGFYVGANAGYSWSNSKVDNVGIGTVTLDPFFFGVASNLASGLSQSIKTDPHGFIGGGQIGYNWQFAPQWVGGIEADISGAGIKGSDNKVAGFASTSPFFIVPGSVASSSTTLSAQEQVDWLGTVRGRLGFLPNDRLLVYGTGGLAYGHVKASTAVTATNASLIPPPGTVTTSASSASASVSETRIGWAAGLGVEYGLTPNWTVRTEWLHWDLGSVSYSSTMPFNTPLLFVTGTVTTASTAHFRGDIARAAMNYRF
jgi:outer membrane immunogenic protein